MQLKNSRHRDQNSEESRNISNFKKGVEEFNLKRI
jgi:hypothetical protein